MRTLPVSALCLLAACAAPRVAESADRTAPWVEMFDGRTLAGWTVPEFGGEGEVKVDDGRMVIGEGQPMTGVTWKGAPLPRTGYEVELRAARFTGLDFFAALTFPVGEGSCSLVLGGWGGSVVGLSCIDGFDADNNPTRRVIDFDDRRFYDVRVAVTADAITAWLDGEEIVRQKVAGHEFAVRGEVLLNEPFGIATYSTTGVIERVRWRPLR